MCVLCSELAAGLRASPALLPPPSLPAHLGPGRRHLLLGAAAGGPRGAWKCPPNTTCEEGWGGARREWGERFLLLPNPRHNRRLEPCCPPTWLQPAPKLQETGRHGPLLPELPWGGGWTAFCLLTQKSCLRKLGTICKAGLFHLQTISLLTAQGRGSKARAIFLPPGVLGRWKGEPPGGKGLGLGSTLTSSVTLGRWVHLSDPLCPLQQNRIINTSISKWIK